jgi:hypothetical protein
MEQVGQGTYTAQVAPYYVPAPDAPSNYATAFMSSYLRRRTPQAEQVFTARLAALDPSAQAAALAALDQESSATIAEMAKYETDSAKYAVDTGRQQTDIEIARIKADADVNSAGVRAGADERIAQADRELKASELQNLTPKEKAPVQGYLETADGLGAVVGRAKAKVAAAPTPKARALAVDDLKRATALWTRAAETVLTTGRNTMSNAQLRTLDLELQQQLGAHLGAAGEAPDADKYVTTTWAMKKDDSKLMPSYAPPEQRDIVQHGQRTATGYNGGAGGSVSVAHGSRGVSPDGSAAPGGEGGAASPAMDAARAHLADLAQQRADMVERFKSPYGGFHDPLPGTARGFMGGKAPPAKAGAPRPTSRQMAEELASIQAGGGAPPPSAAPPPEASPVPTAPAKRSMRSVVEEDLDALQPPQSEVNPDEVSVGTSRSAGRKYPAVAGEEADAGFGGALKNLDGVTLRYQ